MNAHSPAIIAERDYADLEPLIRDLSLLAEIARFHAFRTFGENCPAESEGDRREREKALLLISQVEDMARELEKQFDAVG